MSMLDNNDNNMAGIIAPTPFRPELSYHERHIEREQQHAELSSSNNNKSYKPVASSDTVATDDFEIDTLLAKELNQMSFQQRESINEEIHGINVDQKYLEHVIEETPELLKESFCKLNVELEMLRPTASAFNRSQELYGSNETDTTYINTEEFRIMFLRCELFDCCKAANRMCAFIDLVYELYGDIALKRRAYLTDLDDNIEGKIMRAGYSQVLPGRDRSGRRIFVHVGFNSTDEYTAQSRLRIAIYCLLSLLEDEETQKKGVVTIFWHQNISILDDIFTRGKSNSKIHCIPIRVGAFHICFISKPSVALSNVVSSGGTDNSSGVTIVKAAIMERSAKVLKTVFALALSAKLRPRLRFHTGSAVECLYALQTFGIPSDQVPIVPSTGKVILKNHLKWLELCKLKDDNFKMYGREWEFDRYHQIIECPSHSDILFGRGRPIMNHPGNAVLRNVVRLKLEEYCNVPSNKQATTLTWEVVRILKDKYGARFLKEETTESNGLGWIEVSNDTARLKVRVAFRDKRTKLFKTTAAATTATATANTTTTTNSNTNTAGTNTNPNMNTSETTSSTTKTKRKVETPATPTPSLQISSFQVQQQHADSSTFAFLGMTDSTEKRQRCQSYFDCV